MKHIYQDFKSKYYFMEGFEEYITNEETQIKIINQINDYDKFFISLISNDKNKLNSLVNKFYINEENKNMYKYQFNDEFDSLFLYFSLIIDDNEEIAKSVLVPNVTKLFEFLNKNYKYTLIEVMLKYIYLITNPKDQKNLVLIIIQDYYNNFYNSSFYITLDYRNAICNFTSLNDELITLINNELIWNQKKLFIVSVKIILQAKKNRRKYFDMYIEKMKQLYQKNKIYSPERNIVTYFESNESGTYNFLKQFWFKEPENDPLLVDVIYNYLKDKLNITNDNECSQLLSVTQDFVG